MKQITLFLALLFFAIFVNGKDVPSKTIEQVAKNFFYERVSLNTKTDISEISIRETIPVYFQGDLVYYVVNMEDNIGFVIVSADDVTVPVLSYSFGNTYENETDLPPGLIYWLGEYKKQIDYIKTNNIESEKYLEEWQKYSQKVFSPAKGLTDVAPLTNGIAWGQGCYYNQDCPSDAAASSYCSHTPVGCVATAMCQIMKFWGHPATGFGSKTYTSSYGTLSADFGATTYNWAAMPNSISTYNTQIAQICSHTGISVEMNYSASGSGAYSNKVATAFKNFFRYSTTAIYRSRYYSSDVLWKGYLTTDLDAGRPVYYSGTDSDGTSGHAFVCDGYQGTDYFHFNWGWNGYYNSYNYIDDLVPGGTGTGGGTGDYSYNQEAVFSIFPNVEFAANFTVNYTSIIEGGQVDFTDISTNGGGSISSYSWSFPGGSPSSYTGHYPPNITYNTAGSYNVSLTIVGTGGTDTETKVNYITVLPLSAGFTMNFEGCTDFSSNFSPWLGIDNDGLATYGSSDCDFTGENGPMSFIAFNPTLAGFALSGTHGGSRCGLSICPADASASDDYLVSPKISLGTESSISLWVRSPKPGTWGNDTYKIEVSTSTGSVGTFTAISGSTAIEAPAAWTQHTYDLSAYNSDDVYVAIHHVTADKFMLLIDDIVISTNTTGFSKDEINSCYLFPNPSNGKTRIIAKNIISIDIFSLTGKVLDNRKLNLQTNAELDLTNLPKGVYLVKVVTVNGSFTKKLVLE